MRRSLLVPSLPIVGLLLILGGGFACGGGSSSDGSGGKPGGTGGASSGSGGSTGTGTGGSAATPDPSTCFPTATGSYTMPGACGDETKATASATAFDGKVVYYLIDDSGLGVRTCEVQFDVKRVGDAPGNCPMCLWSHKVELSNPMVLMDKDGVCAKSARGLAQTTIDCMKGKRFSVAFVNEYLGAHASAALHYYDNMMKWDVYSYGTWDMASGAFRSDNKSGACNY